MTAPPRRDRGLPESVSVVPLGVREICVVLKGVGRKPRAERKVKLMLIELRGVPNTG